MSPHEILLWPHCHINVLSTGRKIDNVAEIPSGRTLRQYEAVITQGECRYITLRRNKHVFCENEL